MIRLYHQIMNYDITLFISHYKLKNIFDCILKNEMLDDIWVHNINYIVLNWVKNIKIAYWLCMRPIIKKVNALIMYISIKYLKFL